MKIRYRKISGIARAMILVLVMLAVMIPERASAASVNVSAKGGTIEKGETITVTVSLSSSATIGAYRLSLTYDSSVIEYVPSAGDDAFCNGGSGTLIFVDSPYSTSDSHTVKFKGIGTGTSKLTVSCDAGDILDDGYNDMTVTTTAGSVTVNPPREASSDATLSSLSVGDGALSPSFSSGVTEYSISVGAGTEALTINAKTTSSYAKVSVSGNELKEGDNTVKITVTAENGNQKVYYIYVNKAAATPTPSPEPTATPTETPIPTPGTEVLADVLKVDENGNAVIKQETFTLADTITAEIPAGFDKTSAAISGIDVEVLKLNDGNLVLVQLSDGNLYVYDSGNGSFRPYQVIDTSVRHYRIGTAEEAEVPAGYSLTAAEINGVVYPAYRLTAGDEFLLVYVEGSIWYRYDTVEGTIQRYAGGDGEAALITQGAGGDVNPAGDKNGTATATTAAADGTVTGDFNRSEIVKIVIMVLVFVLAIVFMILYVRERNRNLGYIADEEAEQLEIQPEENLETDAHEGGEKEDAGLSGLSEAAVTETAAEIEEASEADNTSACGEAESSDAESSDKREENGAEEAVNEEESVE